MTADKDYEQKKRQHWHECAAALGIDPGSRTCRSVFSLAYSLGKETDGKQIADPAICPGQTTPEAKMDDSIIKRGFHNHNRMHLASLAMAGMLASGDTRDLHEVAMDAVAAADTLMACTRDISNYDREK